MKWFPWRSILRRVAMGHGFVDPFALMARLQRFAQPSEVAEPIELLRAGVAMHARGLINSRVIQNNLDWIWPYWVCRQVDPADPSFLPRAFSLSQINLTHRNWTAVGLPDCLEMPIVDPRGLVTPLLDGWSIDAWILADDGRKLFPSRTTFVRQYLNLDRFSVVTQSSFGGLELRSETDVVMQDGQPVCRIRYAAVGDVPGWIVIALRPYNTEGISFIDGITLSEDRQAWSVANCDNSLRLTDAVERHDVSHYLHGDVTVSPSNGASPEQLEVDCKVGMATAAASYRLDRDVRRSVGLDVSLDCGDSIRASHDWSNALGPAAQLAIPDDRLRFLYHAAVRTLVVLSPDDVYPGPGTYRRFWFRDAAFMINAMLCSGLHKRSRRALNQFPKRQTMLGYFLSQNGEWDSNGQALWILDRYCELTGEKPDPHWHDAIIRGARWINRKRTPRDAAVPHAGLLPAGFSAEHLGPNDFYYWDDFWAVSGLRSAARMAERCGKQSEAEEFGREAEDLMRSVEVSLRAAHDRLGRSAMPASPYRRLDAGAIGSIVAGYPLQLFAAEDPRLTDSVDFLMQECLVKGAFFQDIIHSGINAYLTLHIAQVLMRAGDPRCFGLIDAVADLASPTGQWPEAIHPQTLGGCMGDGQHGWAAAEWVMIMRNSFVREESDTLVLGAGLRPEWLKSGERVAFGPAPTVFGSIHLSFRRSREGLAAEWRAKWRTAPRRLEFAVPGFRAVSVAADQHFAVLQPAE